MVCERLATGLQGFIWRWGILRRRLTIAVGGEVLYAGGAESALWLRDWVSAGGLCWTCLRY